MVSKSRFAVLSIMAARTLLAAPQQTPESAKNFRPDTATAAPAAEKPPVVVTPELRGDIFMAKKMYREAAEAYGEGPKTAVLLNKTGIAYHQMQELDVAKKYYEKAIKADPHYAEAVNNLGTIYYAQKSYRRSVTQYLRALRLAPNSASIYSNLATGYFARKDYKRATEACQHALELDPDVFERRGTHGVLLQERSVDEWAQYHYFMAKMYASRGDNDRAILYIRKALEEGFKERNKFEKDPEFAGLKDLKEFKDLLASSPRVL